jgi:hypothetical protein
MLTIENKFISIIISNSFIQETFSCCLNSLFSLISTIVIEGAIDSVFKSINEMNLVTRYLDLKKDHGSCN